MDDQSTDLHHALSLVDRVGKASIELHAGFDPKLLREAVQALGTLPPTQDKTQTTAQQGLQFCNQLFAIERDLKDVSRPDRAQPPHFGRLFGMAASAAIPHNTKEQAWRNHHLQPEPMGKTDGILERRATGDRQQPIV